MSSPTPHKSDSGKRRSALTSAFEELALHTANLNDEVRPNSTTRPGLGKPPLRPGPAIPADRKTRKSVVRSREIPTDPG